VELNIMSLRANHRSAARRQPRRGIILLFVMALLALFALVTVTFVIVAHSHKQSAGKASHVERNLDISKALLDRTITQILVGSEDPFSVLRPHGLLEDMYGNDNLVGFVAPANDSTYNINIPVPIVVSGQLLQFGCQLSVTLTSGAPISALDDYYAGRVLTFTTGSLAGKSFRITASRANALQTIALSVLLEDDIMGQALANGSQFIVNGQAFNGSGFGFDLAGMAAIAGGTYPGKVNLFPFLGAGDPSLAQMPDPVDQAGGNPALKYPEYALLPNSRFFTPTPTLYSDPAGPGGADEDNDVADMQNMLLGFERVPVSPGGDAPVAIPSLHRPELVHYWLTRLAAQTNGQVKYVPQGSNNLTPQQAFSTLWDPQGPVGALGQRILRRAMLRPVGGFPGADHPEFTGSNPGPQGFDPVLGGRDVNGDGRADFFWDVDNDGDGVPDSIWVDIGLPPRPGPDGRMVKPLVAVLCLDQDGKLNLNAHGTMAQVQQMGRDAAVVFTPADFMNWPIALKPFGQDGTYGYKYPPAGTNGSQLIILPEGSGYGPAEINLRPLFITNPAEYLQLMAGIQNSSEGRYGERKVADYNIAQSQSYIPMPGMQPWINTTTNDPRWNWLQRFERFSDPLSYWPSASNPVGLFGQLTSYFSPPDLSGDGRIAIDMHGQRIYANLGKPLDGVTGVVEKFTSPYNLDLSRSAQSDASIATKVTSVDSPYTPAEWERLLRYGDIDSASMPRRLLNLASSAFETGVPPGQSPTPTSLAFAAINRKLVTTESWDVNVPTLSATMDHLAAMAGAFTKAPSIVKPVPTNLHLAELLQAKIITESNLAGKPLPTNWNLALRRLLPWEIFAGSKLNLNRPFGNERDDSPAPQGSETIRPGYMGPPGMGVVDEPLAWRNGQAYSEVNGLGGAQPEQLWQDSVTQPGKASGLPVSGAQMDHNNDGQLSSMPLGSAPGSATPRPFANWADNNDLLSRQLMARHLYVLIASLIDSNMIQLIVASHNQANPTDLWSTGDIYRRFAQWAVNIVDFRDPDSIMTAFEFDPNPFVDDDSNLNLNPDNGTWDVDDDPSTLEPAAMIPTKLTPTGVAQPVHAVVWGCERPELLMTETLAAHDLRTGDTARDTVARNAADPRSPEYDQNREKDKDFDQVKPPQGTFLLELYNPWSTAPTSPDAMWNAGEAMPAELYGVNATGGFGLQLDRVTPNGDPVWRIVVINESRDYGDCPDNPRYEYGAVPGGEKIDRTIYFSPQQAGSISNAVRNSKEPFFRSGTSTTPPIVIPQTSYAVVGGNTKLIFEGDPNSMGGSTTVELNSNAAVNQSGLKINGSAAKFQTDGRPLGPIAVVIDQALDATSGTATTRALNLSEPFPGSASDYASTGDQPLSTPDDDPWDYKNKIIAPSGQGSIRGGTTLRKFTIFLQRLANPLMPWNPQPVQAGSPPQGYQQNQPVNSYVTVDHMYVDLTVYTSQGPGMGINDPLVPMDPFKFNSRERGFLDRGQTQAPQPNQVSPQAYPNIWSSRFQDPTKPNDPSTGQEPANGPVQSLTDIQTLGYLNRVFGTPLQAGTGYGPAYRGDPSTVPFPALTWRNRPYANANELLLAPTMQPFELLYSFTVRNPLTSPYTIGSVAQLGASDGDPFRIGPYGGLGPLMMSLQVPQSLLPTGITAPPYSLPNFFRLLDFVQVPSRFVGTETVLNPSGAMNTAGTGTVGFGVNTSVPPQHRLYPPFNRVSRFREPGKININTAAHASVWAGLVNGTTDSPVSSPLYQTAIQWAKMVISRRGTDPQNPNLAALLQGVMQDPTKVVIDPVPNLLVDPPLSPAGGLLPTYFAAPFRSSAGVYLVPTSSMRLYNNQIPATFWSLLMSQPAVARNEVEATLLRSDPVLICGAGGPIPLFANAATPNTAGPPPGVPVVGPSYSDPVSNPDAFYRPLEKLGGLVTTRSNVYAVWVTLGFFECDQVPIDEGHPDGYRLGREAGVDTGEVRRHRAFFIVDRSIPVGFQRGEAHNSEKAILLRRFIE
jgi:hypothetical protein